MPNRRTKLRLAGLGVLAALAACQSASTGPSPDADPGMALRRGGGTRVPQVVIDYYRVFMTGFPGVTKGIWNGCFQDGQVNLVGVRYEPGVNCRLVPIDGYPRRFVVYVPPALPAGTATPVVLMHHGSTGTGEQFLNISGWVEEADARGFVAVFPTALEYFVLESGRISTKWHEYDLPAKVDLSIRPPGYPAAAPWPARDSAFVDAIVDDLDSQLPVPVDPRRIYASGFSNGGAFTARLAIELSDRLAAVGLFAGGLSAAHAPKRRIPVAFAVGTHDDGVIESANAMLLPGQDSIATLPLAAAELLALTSIQVGLAPFLESFALDPAPSRVVEGAHATRVRWSDPLPGNTDGNEFGLAVFEGVIHHYPHLGSPRSKNPFRFSAAQLFWQFFEAHPKP